MNAADALGYVDAEGGDREPEYFCEDCGCSLGHPPETGRCDDCQFTFDQSEGVA